MTMYDINDTIFSLDTYLKGYVVKRYDRRKMEGVVLHDNEWKCWDLMHHCVFMHQGISPFYNGTITYVTMQENDHYVLS